MSDPSNRPGAGAIQRRRGPSGESQSHPIPPPNDSLWGLGGHWRCPVGPMAGNKTPARSHRCPTRPLFFGALLRSEPAGERESRGERAPPAGPSPDRHHLGVERVPPSPGWGCSTECSLTRSDRRPNQTAGASTLLPHLHEPAARPEHTSPSAGARPRPVKPRVNGYPAPYGEGVT